MAATRSQARALASGTPVRVAAPTSQVAAAPAGGTGDAAGAYDTAANRNIAIAAINNNRTRIEEVVVALRAAGLMV